MKRLFPVLTLVLLFAACFSIATTLQSRITGWRLREPSGSVFALLLGDGRRLFANHYFTKADIYFHSGYYPSIFDKARPPRDSKHMTEQEHEGQDADHEKDMDFLGPPRDWVERFGRHFMVSEHTHLSGGNEREMLPWLKLSAELDPQKIDTYTVAAFWLRKRLGNPREAEKFLREGLRANPNSYEILFALGSLYEENYHDTRRAENMWELALRRWKEQARDKKEPDPFTLEQITVNLAQLQEAQGHLTNAIAYLEQARQVSPTPQALDRRIAELEAKLKAGANSAPAPR